MVACSKHSDTVADSGCIQRVVDSVGETSLRTSQIDSIKALFSKNNMSIRGLQFIEFTPDIYTDTARIPQAQIWANPFVNGLPVFRYNEVFIFNAGVFDTAYLYSGVPVNHDTAGHQTLSHLRGEFFKHITESFTHSSVGTYVPSANDYKDKCLQATLGYLDAVYVPGNTVPWGRLIKVWAVTPLNDGYPLIYVRDDTGGAWGQPFLAP